MLDLNIVLMETDLLMSSRYHTSEQIEAVMDAHDTLLENGYAFSTIAPPAQIEDLTDEEAHTLGNLG